MNVEAASGEVGVLIVEDDPEIRTLYEMILNGKMMPDRSGLRFRAVAVGTPGEGLAFYTAHPDTNLVVLDYNLPGMKGDLIAERIRKISGNPDIPFVLMVTAMRGYLNEKEMMQRGGINAIIAKPFSPGALVKSLTQAYKRLQSTR